MTILTTQSDSVRAASGTWQQQMKWAVRDLTTLLSRLELPPDLGTIAGKGLEFPVFVPLPLLMRMRLGDPDDPLLRQVLPRIEEDHSPAHFSIDPLAESAAQLQPGLMQKYNGRVLLVTTGACAVHCRYCFRRHFPYSETPASSAQWQSAMDAIAGDASVQEVILSGGDPLTIVDSTLAELFDQLNAIDHVQRIRIHTRLPIMIPQRVTSGLIEVLRESSKQSIIVIHANHARELDESVDSAIGLLRDAGAILLNQSVLLRGINDSVDALVALSLRLLAAGVLPYYLHQLDPVVGTSHFEVDPSVGRSLIEQIRAQLPGYAVPRYVKELAGETNKTVWA